MSIEEDFLEVDQPIAGQNFVCISFISPEKVIKQKEIFFMNHFLLDLLKDDKKREYILNMDLNKLDYSKVSEMIEDFRIVNEKRINDLFDEETDFKTSIRGVKVRGIYDTLKEARVRASLLQKRDPKFNVFVGQCGYWLPWDPSSTDEIDAEYQEKQLNELMKNYKINAEQRDMFYQEDKQRKVDEAIKENAKRKEENIKQGFIKPEKVPDDENTNKKLGEFREILNQKDEQFNSIVGNKAVNTGGSEQAAIVSDNDQFTTEGGHADPWIKRKTEGVEELNVPEHPTETISHDSKDVTATQQNNNLDSVIKNIF